MAHLEIETRDGVQRIALDRDQLSVGRLAYNDVVLPFGQISRQHAELRHIKGQWWIADLHSTNGLHFDSRRISEYALQDGDRILLAPGITLLFVSEDVPLQALEAQPTVSTGAVRPAPAPSSSSGGRPRRPAAPPRPPETPYVPPNPRSPYADDEAPYVPPGMRISGPISTPATPIYGRMVPPAPSSNGSRPSHEPTPFAPPAPAGSQGLPSGGGRNGGTADPAHPTNPGGYPVPSGPLVGGGEGGDPYRRSAPAGVRPAVPTVPMSKLLHVCQTCGQLTAPDAIYCQSCHQPLARECPVCRLNLLPIQEHCPRCHTPNAAYVGKARSTHPPV